jgi:hypothetical protein
MIVLSILIPSIPSRQEKLSKLLDELIIQRNFIHANWLLGEIEFVVDDSPSFIDGGLSIGQKRDSLVQRAQGRYLCFLDDDESIAGNYLQTLVRLTETKADVLTFRSLANLENYWCIVDMSLFNPGNEQTSPDYICLRKPWHICPVKSHIAKVHKFNDSNYGEDFEWMGRVLKACTSEAKSNAVIHMYNHRTLISESDNITRQENV